MPYKIQHKSHNSCLIKYTKGKGTRRKKRSDLSLVVLGIIAIMIGVDMGVVIIACILIWFFFSLTVAPYFNFEIELNRPRNQISIKNSEQAQPKVTTYPLDHFNGFGLRELERAQADLFLKIEPSIGLFQKIPIWKFEHPVPLANATKIIDEVDSWLRLTRRTSAIEDIQEVEELPQEPAQEPEIIRDFRDMD